jgi:hypothetical protein
VPRSGKFGQMRIVLSFFALDTKLIREVSYINMYSLISMRISKKYSTLLFGMIMALMMSLAMSLVMTYVAVGFVSNFIVIWTKSLIIGFIVALPTALVVSPLAKKIVDRIVN